MTGPCRLELSEYEVCRAPAPPPTADDLRLAEALDRAAEEPRVQVRWLTGDHVEIGASSWVGVVRFSGMDIHITPKYIGGALRLLKLIDYTRNTRIVRHLSNTRPLYAEGDHLHELLCKLLADEASRLLRQGLLRNYREESDELAVLRGRLDHRTQYLRRYGQLDRLHCRFDEYDTDNADNQLVCAAIGVAQSIVDDTQLRRDLSQLRTVFSEACAPTTLNAMWYRNRITYGRLNERYRTVHALCYLILEHTAFDDLYDTRGNLSVRSFLVNMNTLFEEFVTTLFAAALNGSDLRVAPKERLKATIIDTASARTYATLVPDLVVTHSVDNAGWERQIPIDIKYKLYDNRKLSTSDIYQSFTYALALSRGDLEALAGVVYPGERTCVTTRLEINPNAAPTKARITAVSLDVKRILDDIGSDGRLPEHLRQQLGTLARTIVAGGNFEPADR